MSTLELTNGLKLFRSEEMYLQRILEVSRSRDFVLDKKRQNIRVIQVYTRLWVFWFRIIHSPASIKSRYHSRTNQNL